MMFKKMLLIICLIICLFSMASVCASEAKDTTVVSTDIIELSQSDEILTDNLNTTEDDSPLAQTNNGELISENNDKGTFRDLQIKINAAEDGGTVNLMNDYTYNESDEEITITKAVTINGNGFTINALEKSRIFNIEASGNIVLNNIAFVNGKSDLGGAIIFNNDVSDMVIDNCKFINNHATANGGALYANGKFINSAIENTEFINNAASKNGGAIYIRGTSIDNLFENLTFSNNNANNADDDDIISVDDAGNIAALAEGNALVSLSVGDDGVYKYDVAEGSVNVGKKPCEIIIANDTLNIKVLNFTSAGATLNPSNAGQLNYASSNTSVVEVVSGIIIPIAPGNAIITVSFNGTDEYAAAENRTISVTVSLNDAILAVDSSALDLKIGDAHAIKATTIPEIAKQYNINYTSSNESVAIIDENGTVTAISEGIAIITVNVGDGKVFSKNSTEILVKVSKMPTKITATDVLTVYNVNKDLIVTLKDANSNPLSGIRITVDLNGVKTYTTDKKGQIKVTTKGLIPKAYAVKVTFNGNARYLKSERFVKVTVKKAISKITAKKKTFKKFKKVKKYTITLKSGKTPIKKAKVTIKIGKKTYNAKTNSKGKATFKIKKLTKKGKYNAKITYKGNYLYKKVTKKVRITVK